MREAPWPPGGAMLETARQVLREAEEDFDKLEAKRARRRARQQRERDNQNVDA